MQLPKPQPEPKHNFDANLFRDTVEQRYLIQGVSHAMDMLDEDMKRVYEKFLYGMNRDQVQECSEELHMISGGMKGLEKLGFSEKERKKLINELSPKWNSQLRAITIACLGSHRDDPLYQAISDQAEAMSRYRFNPTIRETLHQPILKRAIAKTAASIALIMAIANSGSKDSQAKQIPELDSGRPIPVNIVPMPGEDGEAQDPLTGLRKKYEKALEDGTFTFNDFFRDIESIVEMIPTPTIQKANEILAGDLEKLTPALKKLSKKDFLRTMRRMVNSPKYEDDRRNFRASSSMLLTEKTRTGNCEARVRTMVRYIEKFRPELMKDLRVVISKPTNFVDHVELALKEDGSIFTVDDGLSKPLSAKSLAEKQVVTPEEYFVKTFLKQQKIAEEEKAEKRKKQKRGTGNGDMQNASPESAASKEEKVAHGDEQGKGKDAPPPQPPPQSQATDQQPKEITGKESVQKIYAPPSYVTDSSTDFRRKKMIAEHKKRVNSYWAEKLKTERNHTFDSHRPEKKMSPEKGKKYMRIDKFDDSKKFGMKTFYASAYAEIREIDDEARAFIHGEQFREISLDTSGKNMKFYREVGIIAGLGKQNFVTDVKLIFEPDVKGDTKSESGPVSSEIQDALTAISSYDLDRLDIKGSLTEKAVDLIISQKNLSDLSISLESNTATAEDIARLGEHIGKHLQVLETLEVSGEVFEGIAQKLTENNAPPFIRVETDLWSGDVSVNMIEQLKKLYETHGNTTTVLFDRGVSLPSLITLLSLPEEYFTKGFVVLNINVLNLEHGKGYEWKELLPKLNDLRARYKNLTKYAQDDRYVSGAQVVVIQNTASTDEELRVLGEYVKYAQGGQEDEIGIIMNNTSLEQKKVEARHLLKLMPLNIWRIDACDINDHVNGEGVVGLGRKDVKE